MNEINFFEQRKRELINIDINAYVISGIAIGVLLVGSILINANLSRDIKALNNSINENTVELQQIQNEINEANAKASEEVTEEKTVIDIKTKTVQEIKKLSELKVVSSETIQAIQDSMPDLLFLSSLELVDDTLTLTGYTKSSNSVAQFQYNLNKTENIYNAFVPVIDNELGSYSFKITAKIRS